MKPKLILSLLVLGLAARAQNYVQFQNGQISFPTVADRYVYSDYVGGTRLVGTNYVAGLWMVVGTDPDAVDGRISPDRGQHLGGEFPFRMPTTATPGVWNAIAGQGSSFRITLPGVPDLTMTTLQVRVWDRIKYSTFAEAFAAGEYGASEPFAYQVPDYINGRALDWYMDNLRAFALRADGRRMSIQDIIVAEGSNGVVQANFTLTLAQAQSLPVSVNYATQDGTALAGEDYVATNGTVTFAPGDLVKVISVAVTADAPPEADEIFYLNLSNPVNGLLTRTQAACTITEIRIVGVSFDTSVSFNTVLGHNYILERSSNALDWELVPGATNVVGTGGILAVVDQGAGCQTMRAYRARLLSE
jgi:hypothetical protein